MDRKRIILGIGEDLEERKKKAKSEWSKHRRWLWRKKNRQKIRAYDRQWLEKNKIKRTLYHRVYGRTKKRREYLNRLQRIYRGNARLSAKLQEAPEVEISTGWAK